MGVIKVGLRPITFAVLFVFLGGACHRPRSPSSESNTSSTQQAGRASITIHPADAFYDPVRDLPHNPGALLRTEALKDLVLPAGVRGWRIL